MFKPLKKLKLLKPSPLVLPATGCVTIRKIHECHSERKAKNLLCTASYDREILSASPQDDNRDTVSTGAERRRRLNDLNAFNELNSLNQAI